MNVDLDNYYDYNPRKFSELHRTGEIKKISFEKFDKHGNDVVTEFWVSKRKHLNKFLNYLNENFDKVIIWSAGQTEYVESIVEYLYKNIDQKPYDILTYPDTCRKTEDNKVFITKPLRKLFNKYEDMNLSNTLIVDNIHTNFMFHNKFNGICIPHYHPNPLDLLDGKSVDNSLSDLIKYFDSDEFQNCEDYRYIDKSKIFNENLLKDFQPISKNGRK
jgi:hypothetical protein